MHRKEQQGRTCRLSWDISGNPHITATRLLGSLYPTPDAIGTADNPIIWVAGVRLIPNAYYLYQNERYVYMGAEERYAGDTWDGADMEEF